MKNSINKILVSVAFFAAALFSGVVASAQNLEDGTYEETNHIAFVKRATINDDGTYTIDLETFVTGEVTVTNVSIPADIVLVLDVSGSMSDNLTSYTYTAMASASYSYNSYGSNEYYYLHTDGNYYRVYRSSGQNGTGGNNNRRMYFDDANSIRWWLTGTTVSTTQPAGVNNGTTIWTGVLYTRTQTSSQSKLSILKTAVLNFIEIIDQNDLDNAPEGQERLGNRIAIVTFSSSATTLLNGLTPLSSKQSLINAVNGLNANGGTNAHLGMQNALNLLTPQYGPDGKLRQLKTTVMFTDGDPGYFGNWTSNTSLTGQYYQYSENGTYATIRDQTWGSANRTINYARQIKALAVDSENDDEVVYSKVYTVGVFDDPSPYTEVYMGKTSSNYKADATNMGSYDTWDSTDIWSNGNGTALPAADQIYSFTATDAEALNNIFESIAHSSGGSGNETVSGGSAVTVDIVSSSFSVPKGFESSPGEAITVLVAPCMGKFSASDGKDYLTFGEEAAPSVYNLPAIVPTIDESTNKVSTTGFDFGTNWCGYDESNSRYHGYKQIIRFVVTLNEDAIGGPDVQTNDSESGIYLEGATEPLVKFNRPTVKVPVSIWIQKTGLISKTADPTNPSAQGHEDTAVFTLRRTKYLGPYQTDAQGKPISDGNGGFLRINYIYDKDNPVKITYNGTENYELKWETFTKVAVNMKDKIVMTDGTVYDGAVMISGLNSDYIYRIEEDAWAHLGYSFDPNATAHYTMEWDATAGEYKSLSNPFIFDNTSRNNVYAEDVIKNVFSVGTNPASGGSGSK